MNITVFSTFAEISLSAEPDGKRSELLRLSQDIGAQHLTYDPMKGVFILEAPSRFAHLPYIKAALEEREKQLPLEGI